jgi:uncharacterized repeat protein (TIGR04076 family)
MGGIIKVYKVKCKLVKFEGDAQMFPCHFGYNIGDEIYYDGVNFTGNICPHLIVPMMPVVYGVHLLGHNYSKNIAFRYRGLDVRDPSMAKYDGVGWRPVKSIPEAAHEKWTIFPYSSRTEKARGAHFMCADTRTLAHFTCDPVDLSDSEFCQPFYRRAISILEKIEAEPGIEIGRILEKFTDFEKENISPPLTPVLADVLLETLADMDYIQVQDGQARATGKQPPSRPKIG